MLNEYMYFNFYLSNINQIQFWLTFDKKYFFIQAKMTKCSQKGSKLYTFLETTFPEMLRKLIPRLYEYQSSTSSHLVDV